MFFRPSNSVIAPRLLVQLEVYCQLFSSFSCASCMLLFELVLFLLCVSVSVSWSLTSLFSTNMAISETNGHSL